MLCLLILDGQKNGFTVETVSNFRKLIYSEASKYLTILTTLLMLYLITKDVGETTTGHLWMTIAVRISFLLVAYSKKYFYSKFTLKKVVSMWVSDKKN